MWEYSSTNMPSKGYALKFAEGLAIVIIIALLNYALHDNTSVVAYAIALIGAAISNLAIYYERRLAAAYGLPWNDEDEYVSLVMQVVMFLFWPVTLAVLCVDFIYHVYHKKEKPTKAKYNKL